MDNTLTVAKIADFGAARILDSRTATISATKGLNVTPKYTAPELMEGDPDVKPTVKADVYSFGITLYFLSKIYLTDNRWEMFSEQIPFSEFTRLQQLCSFVVIKQGRPKMPIPNISSQLHEIITSCWHQEIEQRPNILSVIDLFKPLELKFMEEELVNKNKSLETGTNLFM